MPVQWAAHAIHGQSLMSTAARRVIVAFPQFVGLDRVEAVRRRYDPLALLTAAHITLVFPFDSELTADEVAAHVRDAVRGVRPFPVHLEGVTAHEGEYLFLNVKHGNDALIALHDRLYSGLLAPFLSREHTYVPHVTVGRLATRAALLAALDNAQECAGPFVTEVSTITVYRIDEEQRRPVEREVLL